MFIYPSETADETEPGITIMTAMRATTKIVIKFIQQTMLRGSKTLYNF